ncbi:MAG TPA: hypothetical protein DCP53_06055 [Elusimicrobia bacterium]|nr:MAG: hypothetical protein A2551_01105 [Elusimicrobia bacterium RIFOXYD2_FULL_34_30]HAM38935.1 hypothetical protein [Elusimicrobiota bacterium]
MTKEGGISTKRKYDVEFYRILNAMMKIHKKIKKIGIDGNTRDLEFMRKALSKITRRYSSWIRSKQH